MCRAYDFVCSYKIIICTRFERRAFTNIHHFIILICSRKVKTVCLCVDAVVPSPPPINQTKNVKWKQYCAFAHTKFKYLATSKIEIEWWCCEGMSAYAHTRIHNTGTYTEHSEQRTTDFKRNNERNARSIVWMNFPVPEIAWQHKKRIVIRTLFVFVLTSCYHIIVLQEI